MTNVGVDEDIGEDEGEPRPRDRRDLAMLLLFPDERVGVDAELGIVGDDVTDASETKLVSSLGRYGSRDPMGDGRTIPGRTRFFRK